MPATAPAAVTLGQTCSPNATSQITAIQTATAAGVPAASAPFTGVITSFSVDRHPTEAFQARLKVFHDNGVNSFTAVANGPLATLNAGLNVIPARVPIAAGDYIGTWGDPGTQRCNGVAMENRMESFFGPEPQPPETFPTNAFNGVIVDLSAQLEPDADSDLFGDESQDNCVGAAGPVNGCPSTITIDSVSQLGKKFVKVIATVPGQGKASAGAANDSTVLVAAAKKKRKKKPRIPLTPASQTVSAKSQQKVVLTLPLTKAARKKLKEKSKLTVGVKATYTPTGGPTASQFSRVKLKLMKKRR